jgi:hypothetical protein
MVVAESGSHGSASEPGYVEGKATSGDALRQTPRSVRQQTSLQLCRFTGRIPRDYLKSSAFPLQRKH